ncbi:hypothetical protein M0813_26226 [Anaeramoeba flamelloides]|uniref:C2H2-type domain-containing protein n=1 Tax=Anaeramoeba flamelloides TaxID=1746091 RepID=A0ABQ8Y0A1_9EUKA|nr:hypothetical protein M0813_26226 [Anaeramoeba flamelloides]
MGKNNNNAVFRTEIGQRKIIASVLAEEIFLGQVGIWKPKLLGFFCNKHKDYINLVGVVKDGDTKLSKIFEATWNQVKILKDRNHLLKNVRKNIEENTKYRCVKKIKTTLTQWIRSKAEISWSSVELKIYIEMSIFHYLNNHCCCEHKGNYTDRYKFPNLNIIDKKFLLEKKKKLQDLIEEYLVILKNNIKIVEDKLLSKTMKKDDKCYWLGVLNEINLKRDFFFLKKINLYQNNIEFVQESEIENQELYSLSPQLIELNDIIDRLSERSVEFFQSGSTNKCESFMNSRTKFVEKRLNITKQWEMRCQFSALNRELPEWKTILMEQLGFQINLPQIISQHKKNLEKKYEKIRQNKQEYKTKRFIRKFKKYSNKNRLIEEGYYIFKDSLIGKNLNKMKYYCRYECNTCYKTKLSQLIHEIIFHKRVLVPIEQDEIAQNILLTKRKLYQIRSYLNSTLLKLKDKVKKNNKAADRLNLNKKNDAFINLSKYITEFENTFKIKKKIRRTKTLNINAGEFNGDIEIFKEVGEVEDGNILETGNLQEEALYDENELEEIEEILTSHRKKILIELMILFSEYHLIKDYQLLLLTILSYLK